LNGEFSVDHGVLFESMLLWLRRPRDLSLPLFQNERHDGFIAWYKLVETTLRPLGYVLDFSYKMPTFSVPLSLYPQGYLNNPSIPVPYVSIAAQKHHIAIYHYGIYADQHRYQQFKVDYAQAVGQPADIGKSCIRLAYHLSIPDEVMKGIIAAYTPEEFVMLYQSVTRK
jgi:hypothetical protein